MVYKKNTSLRLRKATGQPYQNGRVFFKMKKTGRRIRKKAGAQVPLWKYPAARQYR